MRTLRSQLTLTAVALLLGLLVVVQLRAQNADPTLESKSNQDLAAIIYQLNAGNEQLRAQRDAEQAALQRVRDDLQKGENASSAVQSDLDRVRGWAGLDAIFGPGIRLTLTGPVPADVVEDALNELWNAGADGIAVGGVRVVPGVVVSGQTGQLRVGDTNLGSGIEIVAIGDHEALSGALRRPGGFIAQLGVVAAKAGYMLDPLDSVTLPATARSLIPHDAKPSL